MSNCGFLSPHYSFYYPDLTILGGEGPYACGLRDGEEEPDDYIDASSQWGVLALGYNHEALQSAMAMCSFMGLTHVCGVDFRHQSQEQLAAALVKRMPEGQQEWRVFFTNSGTEAIEGAMKLARCYTQKPGFVSLLGAFHGRTMGAMSLGTAALLHKHLFGDFIPTIQIVPGGTEYLKVLENMVYPASQEIAAFFIEPVQGVGGCHTIDPDFVKEIRNFCDRNKVLLVADEVQSGCGRTGKFFAFEHSDIVPDVVCLAKPLGGGLPLGAVIAKKEICVWPEGAHGSTFGGNPMACAAGVALLEVIDDNFLMDIRNNSLCFKENLQTKLSKIYPTLGFDWRIQGVGFMLAIDLPNKEFRRRVMDYAYQEKLLVATAEPSAIRLLPPLNTPQEVLREIADILIRSIDKAIKDELKKIS